VPVRNVALPVVGRVHLEVLDGANRRHARVPEHVPLVRWQ
jgi:hypothetical protein